MNSNLILKGAVSAALVAASCGGGIAHAGNVAPGADNILRVSGATASDQSLARGLLSDLCDAAATPAAPGANPGFNIEVFTTSNDFLKKSGADGVTRNYAIVCRTKATVATGAQSTDVVITKYSGGSGSGVGAVANGTALGVSGSAAWVNFSTCRDAAGAVTLPQVRTEVEAGAGLPAFVLYTNCGNEGSQVPKAGLSDVEPALLNGVGLPLNTAAGASIPMGVAVSSNFFAALQKAQQLKDASGNDCWRDAGGNELTASPLSKYTPECTPSLTRSFITGVYQGSITSLASLRDLSGSVIPTPTVGTAPSSGITLCRRGDTSGTFRSHAIHFLGQFCGSQRATINATTGGGGVNGGTYTDGNTARVFAGTGAGDIQNCLDDKVDQGRYAIGQLSLEGNNFDDTNQRWRYIKIDGQFPSLEATVRGEYNFFFDSSCNRPSAGLSTVQLALASGTKDASGNTLGLCGSIRGETVQVNPSGTFAWLLGILETPTAAPVDPTPTSTWTTADVLTRPINSQTRASGYGISPRNCNPPWTAASLATGVDDKDMR
jgi:hypothetical protein